MKIITDRFKNVQLFASGSSSFDLSNKINEPLAAGNGNISFFRFRGKSMKITTVFTCRAELRK